MNYAAILKFRNEMNPFAQMLHIDATDLSEGYARAEMPVTEELYNPQGAVHGGVLYTLSDIAGGNAAASHGEWIATLDASMSYLRPALRPTKLIAEAHELKQLGCALHCVAALHARQLQREGDVALARALHE